MQINIYNEWLNIFDTSDALRFCKYYIQLMMLFCPWSNWIVAFVVYLKQYRMQTRASCSILWDGFIYKQYNC